MSGSFDPIMRDRHPWVQLVVGKPQSGKTTYMNLCLELWSHQAGGHSLAVDGVCSDPPEAKHLARWASCWAETPPTSCDDRISLVACDEAGKYLGAGGLRGQWPLIENAVARGQHTGRFGTSALLGTQRAKHFHPDIWMAVKRVVVFRTDSEHDLERIAQLSGMTPRALEYVPQLPQGYCMVWDERDGLYYPFVPEWQAAAKT